MRVAFLFCGLLLAACAMTGKATPECTDCEGSVIVFIGLDCPISQKYMARLNELSQKYDSFAWTGLVPQKASDRDVAEFVRDYDAKFSLRIDKNLRLAKRYGATITPEVFVLDKTGTLKYRGAIDNWFFELGKYRQQVTEHYLDSALSAVSSGRVPFVPRTDAIGCFIQFK